MRAIKSVPVAAGLVGAMVATSLTFAAMPASAADSIAWRACAGSDAADAVRCGRLSVPIDRSRPAAKTEIQVAKLPAAQPAKRIGTLFFNPGGPGQGAVGYVVGKQARAAYFPAAVRDRFDIIAVEPRGTGMNPPLKCPLPIDDTVGKMPADAAAATKLARSNRKLSDACAKSSGALGSTLDTASVAGDIDQVRAAIGEQKISFLGLSYGTMLAQSYAEMFPNRVRALVLDGVVDRSLSWERMATDGARAAEDGVDRFAKWCVATATCELREPGVRQAIGQLETKADAGKISDGRRAVRAEDIAQAVNNGLNEPTLYPLLAKALRQASDTGKFGDLAQLTGAKNPNYPQYRPIICQDVPVTAADAQRLPALGRRLRTIAPTLRGYSEFWDIAAGCAGWKPVSGWKPHAWRVPASFPAALVLSGAHDVATPRPWAEAVQRRLPGSRLVRWDGDGHTAWPTHDAAAVQTAITYLTTLRLPAA